MTTRAEIRLTNDVGLHARPAAAFVKKAAGYASTIRVRRDDREADAASLLQVLKLEAGHGATVVIEAEGEDEETAVAELVELLESL
jgi:phosphocarrier protein HPr